MNGDGAAVGDDDRPWHEQVGQRSKHDSNDGMEPLDEDVVVAVVIGIEHVVAGDGVVVF